MLEPTEPASPRAARESNVSVRATESKASGKSKRAGRPSGKSKASGASSRAGRPSGTRPVAPGPRSTRHKKGLLRRTGLVFPAIGVAVVLVAGVTAVAYKMSPNGRGATALSQFMSSLPNSGSIAALENERQQLIVMNAAAQTFSVAAKPVTVDPASVVAAAAAASQQASSGSSSSGGSSSTSGGGAPVAPAPNPGSAQRIAYDMLPSFGFNQGTQYSCLVSLWNQESGWRWDAENASGAYGIPQALPGSKMSSAGSDWQTNPATQIRWGLGYISSTYGTPCNAEGHEQADGWY